MIVGQEKPDAGTLKLGETVELAYVDQSRDSLDPKKNVWQEISGGEDRLMIGKREVASRAYVSWFNFNGSDQQKKVGDLSGGERNRVHLAKLLQRGGNVLLLDEPTNDLDVDTLRALEDALLEFAGCAVVISHDRWFLDRIATHILAFEGDSKVVWFEGNYQDYEADLKRRKGADADRAASHPVPQAHRVAILGAMRAAVSQYHRDENRPQEDGIVVLSGVAWADYERLLEIRGDHSAPRINYDAGVLEIMSPSRSHEGIKSVIGRLVDAYCFENDIEFATYGSWTLKKKRRGKGAEADECYVFGGRQDFTRPDLAIEVVWTSGRIDKLGIYQALGVREVWYWRDETLEAFVLGPKGYKLARTSKVLPGIDLAELAAHIDRPTTSGAVREYTAKLRAKAKKSSATTLRRRRRPHRGAVVACSEIAQSVRGAAPRRGLKETSHGPAAQVPRDRHDAHHHRALDRPARVRVPSPRPRASCPR